MSDDDEEEFKRDLEERSDEEWKDNNEDLKEHLRLKTRCYMNTY